MYSEQHEYMLANHFFSIFCTLIYIILEVNTSYSKRFCHMKKTFCTCQTFFEGVEDLNKINSVLLGTIMLKKIIKYNIPPPPKKNNKTHSCYLTTNFVHMIRRNWRHHGSYMLIVHLIFFGYILEIYTIGVQLFGYYSVFIQHLHIQP